jgi:hypothetical protein
VRGLQRQAQGSPPASIPLYCSRTCRQKAYEKRKWRRPAIVDLMAASKAQDLIELVVVKHLQRLGLEPPSPPKRRRPNLRVIKPEAKQD